MPELLELAATQHGLITLGQARTAGYTKSEIATMLRRQFWTPRHRSVFAINGAPRTPVQDLFAAVLAGGRHAVASHRSAAWLWALTRFVQLPEISIPLERRCRANGVNIHRLTDLSLASHTHRLGIRTTSPARTLVDLGAVLRPTELRAAVDRSIAAKLVTPMGALHELDCLARRGRAGVGALRAILDEAGVTGSHAPSILEAKTLRLIRRAGLPEPRCELVAGDHGEYRLDFPFPDVLLNVEVDGWEYHSSFDAFHADRTRQNQLSLAGYTFLRYTWRHITATPDRVVAEMRAVHAARLATFGGSLCRLDR